MSELHFKNAVSMKQNRALMNKVLASLTTESENFLSTSESGFFFTFRKTWVDRAMGNETFYWDALDM